MLSHFHPVRLLLSRLRDQPLTSSRLSTSPELRQLQQLIGVVGSSGALRRPAEPTCSKSWPQCNLARHGSTPPYPSASPKGRTGMGGASRKDLGAGRPGMVALGKTLQ